MNNGGAIFFPMIERIRCSYCNLQIESGTAKCPNSSNNGQSFLPYASHIKVNRDSTTQNQACATILFVDAPNARKELCIAWADRRSGDYDIYFANGTNRVYLSVISQYGTPSGTGWYIAGTTALASVQGIVYDSATARHVCTGFAGNGSAPPSGTTNSTSFSILCRKWNAP